MRLRVPTCGAAGAGRRRRPVVLVTETEDRQATRDVRAALASAAVRQSATPVLLDLSVSRNRATAARFHIADAPLLVFLSPRGVILSRDEKPLTSDLLLQRLAEATHQAAEVDAQLAALQEAVAAGEPDAELRLADFLLAHHNAREAIGHLASVAGSAEIAKDVRVRAWVALARAHLWIGEPEKCRHVVHDLLATLGPQMPQAVAGGNLVLGLQDAAAKRVALARHEFAAAIAAAPASDYARLAADAAAKLPSEAK
jgi:hypothetical protein